MVQISPIVYICYSALAMFFTQAPMCMSRKTNKKSNMWGQGHEADQLSKACA